MSWVIGMGSGGARVCGDAAGKIRGAWGSAPAPRRARSVSDGTRSTPRPLPVRVLRCRSKALLRLRSAENTSAVASPLPLDLQWRALPAIRPPDTKEWRHGFADAQTGEILGGRGDRGWLLDGAEVDRATALARLTEMREALPTVHLLAPRDLPAEDLLATVEALRPAGLAITLVTLRASLDGAGPL